MTTLTVNKKRVNLFLKVYDDLVFVNFLYLLQTLRYIITYLNSMENILILFWHSFYIH